MHKHERELLARLGRQIRSARKSRGLSQEGMASEAALDRAYYGRVERGEANVSAVKLQKIASALSLEVADLFPRVGRTTAQPGFHRTSKATTAKRKGAPAND